MKNFSEREKKKEKLEGSGRAMNLVATVLMLAFGTVFFFIFGHSFYSFKFPFYIFGFFLLLSLYLAISLIIVVVNGLRLSLSPNSIDENRLSLPKKDPNIMDQWDNFWGMYMEWSIRGVCYFSNFLFLKPIKQIVIKNLSDPSLYDILLLTYSMGLFTLIEKIMQKRFNPKYENLNMSAEELAQRVAKERILYSALIFSLINGSIGLPVGIAAQDVSPMLGVFAVTGALGAGFGGILSLVGRNDNGYRRPKLYPLGMIFFFLPTGFIIHMAAIAFLG